jgi:hypothetical protein
VATVAIRLICVLVRAASVERYCSSAWRFRLRRRPKKSISHDVRPTLALLEL